MFWLLDLAIFRFGYMCQRKTIHTMQYRLEPSKDYTSHFNQSITNNCWCEIKVEGRDLVHSKWAMCLFSGGDCAPVVADCHTWQHPWLCGHRMFAVCGWRLRFRVVKEKVTECVCRIWEKREWEKVKSSPVTGLEWPRGFQEVKVPRFHDNGTWRW